MSRRVPDTVREAAQRWVDDERWLREHADRMRQHRRDAETLKEFLADQEPFKSGPLAALHLEVTPVRRFSQERAVELGYLDADRIEECKVDGEQRKLILIRP